MFFAFEGGDATGKSTQMKLFVDWLRAQDLDVVTCRDPGGTPTGEAIRNLLLDPASEISPRCEALLYMAARAELVDEVIRPALKAGQVVVSDRFLLSNIVYQGHAGGIPTDELWQLGHFAVGNVMPDVIFLLDMDPAVAAKRLTRSLDRLEQRGLEYQQRLREGFLAEAARAPEKIVVIDASQSIEAVHQAICTAAARALA